MTTKYTQRKIPRFRSLPSKLTPLPRSPVEGVSKKFLINYSISSRTDLNKLLKRISKIILSILLLYYSSSIPYALTLRCIAL
jgi:hypothetical protein